MLGLRLDEPLRIDELIESLDPAALRRLAASGLVDWSANGGGAELRLTRIGRFLGGAVTAELVEFEPV